MTGSQPEYQYHLKDHLGNVRMTFTSKEETEEATATLEDNHVDEDRANFLNYDNARFVYSKLFDKTNGASPGYAQRLSGGEDEDERIGLGKTFSVMPGDEIHAEVFAKYYDIPVDTTTLPQALRTLLWYVLNPATAGGNVIDKVGYGTGAESGIPWTEGVGDQEDDNVPKAFLNYIWINRDFDTTSIRVKYAPITIDAKETGSDGAHDRMFIDDVVTEAGYVYVFLSNDGEEVREVYFDDFKVEHIKSPVVSSQDYFPFGRVFNSYSREHAVNNRYLYNGKELQNELDLGWFDYGARMYDPSIARWMSVDPLSEVSRRFSQYAYVYDNPLRFIDPDGMRVDDFGNMTFDGFVGLGDMASTSRDRGESENDGKSGDPPSDCKCSFVNADGKKVTKRDPNALDQQTKGGGPGDPTTGDDASWLERLWNSDYVRAFVPDVYTIDVSVSAGVGRGRGATYTLNFITRGKEWGFFRTNTQQDVLGAEIGYGLNVGTMSYMGNVSTLSRSTLMGPSLTLSGGFGVGGNLNFGYGSWSDSSFKPSLVGAGIGIGDTVGVAWVTGETKAGWWPIMDLH